MTKRPLNVFITVDTEIWPDGMDLHPVSFGRALRRDIYGETSRGAYGVPFQLDVLRQHDLTAVFLVESLFATATGIGPLNDITDLITQGGQEVQLHLHPEWVPHIRDRLGVEGISDNIGDFEEAEQVVLLEAARANLQAAGVANVRAFRAGNYGADNRTLGALGRVGIEYDTSYNRPYLDAACGMRFDEPVLHPRWVGSVLEMPITHFEDFPGHFRHAQICACSTAEMTAMLQQAWERDWYAFVIVSHSFELLNERRSGPDRIVVRRFERLCQFLADHRERFRTCGFDQLDATTVPIDLTGAPLKSGTLRTAERIGQQLLRRIR
jgi:hypothetical protein